MRILNVVSQGYRAAIEEQDDPALWICQAISRGGGDIHVLLVGSAVTYLSSPPVPRELVIGTRRQRHTPDIPAQLQALLDHGASVFALSEDLQRYGVSGPADGPLELVKRTDLPSLFAWFDQIWHW